MLTKYVMIYFDTCITKRTLNIIFKACELHEHADNNSDAIKSLDSSFHVSFINILN